MSFFLFAFCDAPERYQISFQDPATTTAELLINLHDSIMIDLMVVVGLILFLLYFVFTNFTTVKNPQSNTAFSHSRYLEIFWTVY